MNSMPLYVPIKNEQYFYEKFFLSQAEQAGFGFVGHPYQRGAGLGSIFSSLIKTIRPLASSVLNSVGKTVGKTALNVAADAIGGENVKSSLRKRGAEVAVELVNKAHNKVKDTIVGNKYKRLKDEEESSEADSEEENEEDEEEEEDRNYKDKTELLQGGKGVGFAPINYRPNNIPIKVPKKRKTKRKRKSNYGDTYY